MYARVTTLEGGEPASAEEAQKMLEETVLPWGRQQPGFKGLIALGAEDGRQIGITLWESKQALEDSAEAASQVRRQTAEEGKSRIVSVESYEVALLRADEQV